MTFKILVTIEEYEDCPRCHSWAKVKRQEFLQSTSGHHVIFSNREAAEKYIKTYELLSGKKNCPYEIVEVK